jgi:tRNA-2-methylthio-N6-dimethylallyladenosine synthase
MKKLFIKTYGCQMNFYDSDHMSNLLNGHGYETSEDIKEADLVILNTCHIRDKAAEKMYSDLGRIKKIYENNNLIKPIIAVAGCVAQAEGKEITNRSPWVDLVVGPQAYTDLPKLLKKINENSKKKEINLKFPEIPKFDLLNFDKKIGKVSDFVTIQEGCDKFCSFCVVPFTRGPEYSRPRKSILDEIKIMAQNGVKEITLLGQNVNAWKDDANESKAYTLGHLIEDIAKIDEILSIRYTTSHPLDMDLELIKAHKNVDKLMPYLHLPIQSGSDVILKKMNRKHTASEYLKIIELVRKYCEDIAISSDFIVGHPGETCEDHKKTLDIINEVQFASSYSFMYSERPGTKSSEFGEIVDENIKKIRLHQIQNKLNHYQLAFNKNMEGFKFPILITDKNKNNQFLGRSPYNQTVYINEENLPVKKDHEKLIGSMLDVKIIKSNQNSLLGSFTKNA